MEHEMALLEADWEAEKMVAHMEEDEWRTAECLVLEVAERLQAGAFGALVPRSIVCDMLVAAIHAIDEAGSRSIPKEGLPDPDTHLLEYLEARATHRRMLEVTAVNRAIQTSRVEFNRVFKGWCDD